MSFCTVRDESIPYVSDAERLGDEANVPQSLLDTDQEE